MNEAREATPGPVSLGGGWKSRMRQATGAAGGISLEGSRFAWPAAAYRGIACSVPARARRPQAPPFLDSPGYARHRPEATLLYRLVAQHYRALRELRAESGRPLPNYVEQEFEAYVKCGRLEHGFLRLRC